MPSRRRISAAAVGRLRLGDSLKEGVTPASSPGPAPALRWGGAMNRLPWEPAVRLGCFAGVLLLMALWEALAPRRRPTAGRPLRWASNLGLVALNTLALRFLAP